MLRRTLPTTAGRWRWVLPALLAVAAAAAACGGSGKDQTPTPAPTWTPVRLPSGDATAIAASTSGDLLPWTGSSDYMTIGFPVGWTTEGGGAYATASLWTDSLLRASIALECREGMSIDTMISADTQGVSGAGLGTISLAGAEDTTVAGFPAKRTRWSGSINDVHDTVWIATPRCGWRVSLAAFNNTPLETLEPLFEKVLASFKPAP